MRIPTALTFVALLSVCACQTGRYGSVHPFTEDPAAEAPTGWDTGAAGTTSTGEVLYGWDGAPIGVGGPAGRTPGSVQVTEGGLGPQLEGADGGSRLVLLELYQQAIEERDELALEVDAQNTALEQAEVRYRALEGRMNELLAANDALSAENTSLVEERRALAARLTTAQIRRLQAEKAWLESALQWQVALPTDPEDGQ